MVDQDKPFKTVEVIDSRTAQVCKIACMSCIRGHRTTSCGIPVCRNKIFWTVKRPGRPSASCNCRYGASGGCKCVVAKSACPHKAKKGEKRSGECRCDEQGRYCCILEPDHWSALFALQKPRVNFYPSREELAASQSGSSQSGIPSTPAYSNPFTPSHYGSVPSTPGIPPENMQRLTPESMSYNGLHSPQNTSLTPRFGMMGIGAPQGHEGIVTPNVLSWQGQTPIAPEPYQPVQYQPPPPPQPEGRSSCCGGSASASQQPQYITPGAVALNAYGNIPAYSMPADSQLPETLAYNKMTNDYFNYQFPNAICQNCGLSGCTCRRCPPVIQDFNTGSWASFCGRKHARATETPQPEQPAIKKTPMESDFARPDLQQAPLFDVGHDFSGQHTPMPPSGEMVDFNSFALESDFGMPNSTNHVDLSDMLVSDLEQPSNGDNDGNCCCDNERGCCS